MHELSVVQSILEIVQQHLPDGNAKSVKAIRVKVGEMSGVAPESLEFCFASLAQNTPLRNATLQIDLVPYSLHCAQCATTFTSNDGTMICPICGGHEAEVLSGDELRVSEIELRDELVGTQ